MSYIYRIGRYEVSEEQINKANAAGGLGISLSSAGTNKPAVMITFYEAARFVNWLNTSRGYPRAYNFSAQGEWLLWAPGDAWQLDGENRYRHKDAFFFLPSDDEWYKAAYFNGTNYYRYPIDSNRTPVPVARGTEPGTAVYAQPEEAGPADVDDAGGLSFYGTMAQGGNVWEWVETAYDGVNDATDKLLQVRGGKWSTTLTTLRAAGSNNARPWQGVSGTTGFRVAARTAPVPSAPILSLKPLANGEGMALTFSSEAGVSYDIEKAADAAGEFLTVATLTGTGSVLEYAFKPMAQGLGFYRVVATRTAL